jgi:hypothetical protein
VNCAKTVTLSLQGFSSDRLTSLDVLLRDLAELMIRRLRLAAIELEKLWDSSLGPPFKLTYLIEDYILSEVDVPIVLAIDEVDLLLRTSFYKEFFAMVRWWHDRRAYNEEWDRLNIVMVISTEPYLLMPNSPQSPFNVGTKLSLKDFIQNQVRDLNQRHGSPVSDNDFPQLMRLLNGHPYLTRLALYTLVVEKMTWDNLVRTSMAHEGPFGNHLWHHYLQLRNDRRLRKALKEVIRYDCCSDEMSLVRLLKAGLVKGQGNVYTCRCDLYRMYFEEKLQ